MPDMASMPFLTRLQQDLLDHDAVAKTAGRSVSTSETMRVLIRRASISAKPTRSSSSSTICTALRRGSLFLHELAHPPDNLAGGSAWKLAFCIAARMSSLRKLPDWMRVTEPMQ